MKPLSIDRAVEGNLKKILDGYGNPTALDISTNGARVVGDLEVTGNVNDVDIATRDAVLTSTTTTANASLPKAGGTMSGDVHLRDNVKAIFNSEGNTSYAQYIKSDGTNLEIVSETDINVQATCGVNLSTEYASITGTEGVNLYSNGNAKLSAVGGGTFTPSHDADISTKKYVDDNAGGATAHCMDWYYYGANLSTQNRFYSERWNDDYGINYSINTDLSSSGYSTTTLNNAWRMIRNARRVPYAGTITKFMVNLEATGAAADSDVEVALWWADALSDDTSYSSGQNFTCNHLCTLTFDFSSISQFMSKQTTSFNATAISEGDWLFVTLRKTTSGDGSSFHCYSHVLWDGA